MKYVFIEHNMLHILGLGILNVNQIHLILIRKGKKHTQYMFENKVLGIIFEKVTGGSKNHIMRNFKIFTHQHTLLRTEWVRHVTSKIHTKL
jgi:hypothetical protein